jgi:isoleucyl-tRNA synthetase
MELREAAGRELEKLRVAGEIGASLDAEVDLYCPDDLYQTLAGLDDELRFALITSYARLHRADERPAAAVAATLDGGSEVWILAAASAQAKCGRCWHRREDVGRDASHPELCGRCVKNVAGAGELRRHA